MIQEYVLRRLEDVNGKINFSWGKTKKDGDAFIGPLITWDWDWLRREARRLKVGEERIYRYDDITHKMVGEGDTFITEYIRDWHYYIRRIRDWVQTKWEWYKLPKEERERRKHLWDGIQIQQIYAHTFPAELVEPQPMDPPKGLLFMSEIKLKKTEEIIDNIKNNTI